MGCGSSSNDVAPSTTPAQSASTPAQSAPVQSTPVESTPVEPMPVQETPVTPRPASRVSNKLQTSENTTPAFDFNSKDKKYKLTYFDFTGRGEFIRLVFVAGGLDYEDFRFKHEEWADFKKFTPHGQVPVLGVKDSPVLIQHRAIARYVAGETGLAGRNSLEMAKVDAVVETAADLFDNFADNIFHLVSDQTEENKKIIKDFVDNTIPVHLEKLQFLIISYGFNDYFVGEKLTLADLYVHQVLSFLLELNPFILESFPFLQANREKTEAHPNLVDYLANRK